MWTELIEMVEKKCQDGGKARAYQAKASVLLYGSLTNCHEAFMRYKQSRSDADLANAAFAMDSLISTLQNLDALLSLFDSAVAEKLQHYALEESRRAYLADPKELLKNQVELLRTTMNAETRELDLSTDDLTAFTGSKVMLARFICNHFSLDELFESHSS